MRLVLLDMDGTLIEPFLETRSCRKCLGTGHQPGDAVWGVPREKCRACRGTGVTGSRSKRYDTVTLLPGRQERVKALLAAGDRVAIVTNQGGVAFGYQSKEQATEKIGQVLSATGIPGRGIRTRPSRKRGQPGAYAAFLHPKATVEEFVCSEASDWRKPGGGMIRQAMRDYGVGPADVVMVGDMDTDRLAAVAAGVAYRDADEFFGPVLCDHCDALIEAHPRNHAPSCPLRQEFRRSIGAV